MATKLYLHEQATDLTGTLPTTEQSALTATAAVGGGTPTWNGGATNRTMNPTIGVLQSTYAGVANSTTTAQTHYIGRWLSAPLSGAQTVGGGQVTLNVADRESNANANFFVGRAEAYIWRPGTGTKVGTILASTTAPNTSALEPTSQNSEQVSRNIWNSSTGVAAQDGDVIVIELWAIFTMGMASNYVLDIYYDGTTENTTENAVVSSHASYFELATNNTFQAPSSPGTGTGVAFQATASFGSAAARGKGTASSSPLQATLTHLGGVGVGGVGGSPGTAQGEAVMLLFSTLGATAAGKARGAGGNLPLSASLRPAEGAGAVTIPGEAFTLSLGHPASTAKGRGAGGATAFSLGASLGSATASGAARGVGSPLLLSLQSAGATGKGKGAAGASAFIVSMQLIGATARGGAGPLPSPGTGQGGVLLIQLSSPSALGMGKALASGEALQVSASLPGATGSGAGRAGGGPLLLELSTTPSTGAGKARAGGEAFTATLVLLGVDGIPVLVPSVTVSVASPTVLPVITTAATALPPDPNVAATSLGNHMSQAQGSLPANSVALTPSPQTNRATASLE